MTRRRLSETIASFDAIGLDELTAEAALLTRTDRKYVLARAEAERVIGLLDAAVSPGRNPRVLEHAGVRGTHYSSVYFDTPDFASFHLAAHSRRRRFKVRTRCYAETHSGYLEVKTNGARSATVKERIPYAPEAVAALTAAGRDYAEAALDGIGFGALAGALAPVLVSRYERTTLYLPGSTSRATIDTRLAWELDDGQSLSCPELIVIETKSSSTPSELDRLLWAQGHRPDRISKYATGLAALRPELPANRWNRVLRRHFTTAPRALAA